MRAAFQIVLDAAPYPSKARKDDLHDIINSKKPG